MFNATVGLMLPVFARQRELSEGAEMDAMARASESERLAAEVSLRGQVAATHASALAAQRSARLLADTVVVTQRKALEASWSAYAVGQTDLWRVFEAAHALYAEEISLTRARQQLAAAQGQLVALTGRGDLLGVPLPRLGRSKP
jgi:outer membrane protein TolC